MLGGMDEQEVCLGLVVRSVSSNKTWTYGVEEAYERLDPGNWLGFCVAASIAANGLLSVEKPETYYIYCTVQDKNSSLQDLPIVVSKNVEALGYEMRKTDPYLGTEMWVGVRK